MEPSLHVGYEIDKTVVKFILIKPDIRGSCDSVTPKNCDFFILPLITTSFRVFDIMFVKPIMMSLEISDAEVQGKFIKYKNGNLLLFP